MELHILPTDTLFRDSPDTGDPSCLCSRCNKPIPGDEPAIRAWPSDPKGLAPITEEYRYCLICCGKMTATTTPVPHIQNERPTLSYEEWKLELIKVAAQQTGTTLDQVQVHDASAKKWWQDGFTPFATFRETYKSA